MIYSEKEDWPIGHVIYVPPAWRDDGLWRDIQTKTQCRIAADLQALYAELLQQPLSADLTELAHRIEEHLETSRHGCRGGP